MRMRLKPLAAQTIVITGASSGIGLATARRAAHTGAQVILVSRDETALASVCEEIRQQGGRADYARADVGVREEVRHVVETVVERHGGFDTWVNDAGVSIYARLEDTPDEDHQRMFQTNYWGVVFGSLEALKHLKRNGGALINIGSVTSDVPTPLLSAYTASKHAVKGFTDSLRLELLHEDAPVSVTLIKPSGIHTPFSEHAQNHMDAPAQVPPPVYHPDIVADVILHAAQKPLRDVTVGGAGRTMALLAGVAPRLSDRLFAWFYFRQARNPDSDRRDGEALHAPGGARRHELGDQERFVRGTSLLTEARLHRGATLALALGGAAALIALQRASRPRRRRFVHR